MGSAGFLQGLMTFQKDLINEETVEMLQPYLRMEDYNMESAKKVNQSFPQPEGIGELLGC